MMRGVQNHQRLRSHEKNIHRHNLVKVFNFPQHCNKEDVVFFLWKTLQKAKGMISHGTPVLSSELCLQNPRHIKILFRSTQQAVNCLALCGIYMGNKALWIRSEDQFLQTTKGEEIKKMTMKMMSYLEDYSKIEIGREIPQGFGKIYIGNLPSIIQDYDVVEMLSRFGQLKGFEMRREGRQVQCYCEFRKQEDAQECLARLNGFLQAGYKMIVKRVSLMQTQSRQSRMTIKPSTKQMFTTEPNSTELISSAKSKTSNFFQKDLDSFYLTFDTVAFFKNLKISCVLLLKNIIPLTVDSEVIISQLRRALQKVGPLVRMTHKVMNVYVEYERVEYAQIAFLLVSHRKYNGKLVEMEFYDPIKFADDILV